MAWKRYENPAPDLAGINFGELSDIRRRVIKELLPRVVPSTEGAKDGFETMMSTKSLATMRRLNSKATTCGALPGWLFSQIHAPSALRDYGLSSVRAAARRLNCWVSNSKLELDIYRPTRPKPGDVYLAGSLRSDDEILHIGVIVNPTGPRWWTADAGQGTLDMQQAHYVPRRYDVLERTLTGAVWQGRPISGPYRLVGWVDLDRVRAAYADMLYESA